ncbi:DUF397 domain-containing protein [Streptosporangium saharense]|uniref:DUF397 domain-containing protein n=1 Tax=Streptosporangium saharense TaxID=1706840 RepID=UPI00331D37E1
MDDLTGAAWRRSTLSGPDGGECVEVATNLPGLVAVRDSKDLFGPSLIFGPGVWSAFVRDIKCGSFEG